ncbi:VOC family protein [Sphingomonas sp.]|uniref:VOC family protein n=1 Tax=Sphingomonas sp. TaxID=28214 RepID=UPI001821E686|nr:VOC family protein [Sphingomonas sp.]MBA3511743.1 VOC family protein [Sphingomonas sp.]
MPGLLVNIDVPDIASGEAFHTQAFDLTVGRRFGSDFVELLGLDAPIYLLKKDEGTPIAPDRDEHRRYQRHWTPIHPDIVVDELDAATERALAAGAVLEAPARDAPYGRIAMFADPFGHGFCLIEFNSEGYDAFAT